ncbi:PREDICTED: mitotic-spindle organizing protein 1, partial [Ficedula albicollis]
FPCFSWFVTVDVNASGRAGFKRGWECAGGEGPALWRCQRQRLDRSLDPRGLILLVAHVRKPKRTGKEQSKPQYSERDLRIVVCVAELGQILVWKENNPNPVLFEISRILNTGLDMETLSICVRLCEQGINPEALSSVIKELRKATEALKAAENMTG